MRTAVWLALVGACVTLVATRAHAETLAALDLTTLPRAKPAPTLPHRMRRSLHQRSANLGLSPRATETSARILQLAAMNYIVEEARRQSPEADELELPLATRDRAEARDRWSLLERGQEPVISPGQQLRRAVVANSALLALGNGVVSWRSHSERDELYLTGLRLVVDDEHTTLMLRGRW
jgi:hypothetical protein